MFNLSRPPKNITKRIQIEQLTNNSQFYDNQETHQIKIYISSNILKDNNFKGLLLIKILSKPCLVANILNTAAHELFIFTNHAVKQKKNYNNITVCLEIRQKQTKKQNKTETIYHEAL